MCQFLLHLLLTKKHLFHLSNVDEAKSARLLNGRQREVVILIIYNYTQLRDSV